MRRSLRLSLLVVLSTCSAIPAIAAPQCGDAVAVANELQAKWGEQRIFAGLASATALFETWYNPTTGSWSHTVNNGDGTMCLLASGEHGEVLVPIIKGEL